MSDSPPILIETKITLPSHHPPTPSINVPSATYTLNVTPRSAVPGEFAYVGTHDHGPLVNAKEGGDISGLLGAAIAAQKQINEALTAVVEREREEEKKKKDEDDEDDGSSKLTKKRVGRREGGKQGATMKRKKENQNEAEK